MDHVYMTGCSLIRTFHQMENVKPGNAPSAKKPRLLDWLDGIGDAPSRGIRETEADAPKDNK